MTGVWLLWHPIPALRGCRRILPVIPELLQLHTRSALGLPRKSLEILFSLIPACRTWREKPPVSSRAALGLSSQCRAQCCWEVLGQNKVSSHVPAGKSSGAFPRTCCKHPQDRCSIWVRWGWNERLLPAQPHLVGRSTFEMHRS